MQNEIYHQPPGSGSRCSTRRSARLREHRFAMGYEQRDTPPEYAKLAQEAVHVLLQHEPVHPALARAKALAHVVENCPITPEKDTRLLGGESPFFYNLMYDALRADRYGRIRSHAPDETTKSSGTPASSTVRASRATSRRGWSTSSVRASRDYARGYWKRWAICASPIPPTARLALVQGRADIVRCRADLCPALSERRCNSPETTDDPTWADEFAQAAELLARVPAQPARTSPKPCKPTGSSTSW